ncbi:hypothetical protein BDB01DRAFT_294608 [Pilobolus umbonatus]|nr:hypothetical protein BDB01DRAFT_294608 [Pilobolus umbonatus]
MESEPTAAVLQVEETEEIKDTRSSTSSFDTYHPLELGLVIDVLQNSVPVKITEETKVEESQQEANGIHVQENQNIAVNRMTAREQEKSDSQYVKAVHSLFNNQFMKSKKVLEEYSTNDPVYALGLGYMVFFKAIMTMDDTSIQQAIDVLISIYTLASTQINHTTKKSMIHNVTLCMSSFYHSIRSMSGTGIPTYIMPVKSVNESIPNGILRATIVKAESCLLMALLYLSQETRAGYIKSSLNLRRAYAGYTLVWEEYKRLGQLSHVYIDQETISGIQFGIGTIHLVLSSLPKNIQSIVSSFEWKPDKHLGFALLKICLEGKTHTRSPLASFMLLKYYTMTLELCPLYMDYTQLAIESLLDAQKSYPQSTLFLYLAGLTSRVARNLPLSTQSFMYSIETSKNEWAETTLLHACTYEIGFNHMMSNQWDQACTVFNDLVKYNYHPVLMKYLMGACLDMMGQRTGAILALAELPTHPSSWSESYLIRKTKQFQATGYQDMDMSLCAYEYLYLFDAFSHMDTHHREQYLSIIHHTLARIVEAEKLEYSIRTQELLPDIPPPHYEDQRGALLLMKAGLLNAMHKYEESIIHLNWIIDHRHKMLHEKWVVPYAYWEAGVTSWGLQKYTKAVGFWNKAARYTHYDFQHRLIKKVNLALTREYVDKSEKVIESLGISSSNESDSSIRESSSS